MKARITTTGCVLAVCLCLLSLGGCQSSKPAVYRAPVQQGNVVSVDMLERLRLGMTKNQVRFVLGRSLVDPIFTSDRWDYVYRLYIPLGATVSYNVELYFEDERLVGLESDLPDADRIVLQEMLPELPQTSSEIFEIEGVSEMKDMSGPGTEETGDDSRRAESGQAVLGEVEEEFKGPFPQ